MTTPLVPHVSLDHHALVAFDCFGNLNIIPVGPQLPSTTGYGYRSFALLPTKRRYILSYPSRKDVEITKLANHHRDLFGTCKKHNDRKAKEQYNISYSQEWYSTPLGSSLLINIRDGPAGQTATEEKCTIIVAAAVSIDGREAYLMPVVAFVALRVPILDKAPGP